MTAIEPPPVIFVHHTSDASLQLSVGGESWTTTWGRRDAYGSAAYWVHQATRTPYVAAVDDMGHTDLLSELAFCILGGYGVTAEAAAAAHDAVAPLVTRGESDPAAYEAVLSAPLPTGRRYRFPRQRSQRLACAVARFADDPPPDEAIDLRDWMLELPGVGPKTAAWVVRNHTGSDEVAIIDIWLIRALTRCGVFRPGWDVSRHYERFESAFLQYAAAGSVRPSVLDLCIWTQSRIAGSIDADPA